MDMQPKEAKQPFVDESPLWMGSTINPFVKAEPKGYPGKSLFRVPIGKPPKLALGKQNRRGRNKKGDDGGSLASGRQPTPKLVTQGRRLMKMKHVVAEGLAQDEQAMEGVTNMHHTEGGSDPVRRRRLILEEESEEEFIVHEVPSPLPLRQPVKDTSAVKIKAPGRPPTAAANPRRRAARKKASDQKWDHSPGERRQAARSTGRRKLHSLASKGIKITQAEGQGRADKKMGSGGAARAPAVEGSDDDGDVDKVVPLPPSPRGPPVDDQSPACPGVEDPNSKEDAPSFELHRRPPMESKKCSAWPTQVG
ncbi:unnamed protein product [Linum trigynum]|uniref:Uncharacterized protein n=1 Tax=Linum trigynum TaxID=586398 RepID=A0AAV2E174_9ROSI